MPGDENVPRVQIVVAGDALRRLQLLVKAGGREPSNVCDCALGSTNAGSNVGTQYRVPLQATRYAG